MRFTAVLETNGKTATGIEVPGDVVAALGAGRRPAVRVTFNSHTYRSTIASMGGRFMLPVAALVREQSGATAGDVLDVDIELDTEPRTVAVPADLRAALHAEPGLPEAWHALSFTAQREQVESIQSAKKPETRQRRVAKAVEVVRARAAG